MNDYFKDGLILTTEQNNTTFDTLKGRSKNDMSCVIQRQKGRGKVRASIQQKFVH